MKIDMFSRRHFLKLAGLAIITPKIALQARPSNKIQPNVLFIICDDLNDSVEGMGGHPQAKTPNIDRLIGSGTGFSNAHSNNPVCGPLRASLWSGLYPHTTGYYGHDQNVNQWRMNSTLRNCKTIFEHFSDNGYGVHATGKIFHNNQSTKELFVEKDGKENFGVEFNFGPFPWDGKLGGPKMVTKHSSIPKPFGKDGFETFAPLSDIPSVDPDEAKGVPGYNGWVQFANRTAKPFKYNSPTDRDLMVDELSVEWASKVLKEDHKKPFFLTLGFVRPHSPWIVPKKYFDMFPLDQIKLPPYLENDLDDCGNHIKECKAKEINTYTRFERLKVAYKGNAGWKKWLQAYIACVAFVDDQIGKILNALEDSPYSDNTIVVLTSDHGFHMGEKDLLFKNTVWEESTRVPLVIRLPHNSTQKTICKHPVSLVDLYPTLIDLCNLPNHPNKEGNHYDLDGYSLRPFLEKSSKKNWQGPPVAISCIQGGEITKPRASGRIGEQHFSVRSEQWRYILYSNGEEELYDHNYDPHEWNNLASLEEYSNVKCNLKKELFNLKLRKTVKS